MTNGRDYMNPIIGSIGHIAFDGKEVYMDQYGLTKREYFAAMAMQGFQLPVYGWESGTTEAGTFKTKEENLRSVSADYAQRAVDMADALIEALNAEVAK